VVYIEVAVTIFRQEVIPLGAIGATTEQGCIIRCRPFLLSYIFSVTHSKAKRLISAQNEAIVEQVEQVQRARLVAEVRSAPKKNSMDPQQQQQFQTVTALWQ